MNGEPTVRRWIDRAARPPARPGERVAFAPHDQGFFDPADGVAAGPLAEATPPARAAADGTAVTPSITRPAGGTAPPTPPSRHQAAAARAPGPAGSMRAPIGVGATSTSPGRAVADAPSPAHDRTPSMSVPDPPAADAALRAPIRLQGPTAPASVAGIVAAAPVGPMSDVEPPTAVVVAATTPPLVSPGPPGAPIEVAVTPSMTTAPASVAGIAAAGTVELGPPPGAGGVGTGAPPTSPSRPTDAPAAPPRTGPPPVVIERIEVVTPPAPPPVADPLASLARSRAGGSRHGGLGF